ARKAVPSAAMTAKTQDIRLEIVVVLWVLYRAWAPDALFPDWPRGGVVTQRTANPCTPVRFRPWPPILSATGVRHFVSHFVVFVPAFPLSSFAIAANAILSVRLRYLSRMASTSRRECPVMAAISAFEHSASASRVTAVPRKS